MGTSHAETPQDTTPVDASQRPFQRFFQAEAAGGVLLLVSAAAAFFAANSPLAESYHRLWSTPLTISVPKYGLSLTLHEWVSDVLMAVFFLHVGLEIKRELVAGELSSRQQAALPIAGAIGGMIVPAGIYLLINHSGPEARGWGIAMATDIAFALGALALITPSIPAGAKVFLTALAIVDDMGAVVVIALFYTHVLNLTALALVVLTVGALAMLNRMRIWRLAPYLILGTCLWLLMHASGVHATVAGVLLALTIPTRTRINADEFSTEARALLDDFERTETGDYLVLTSKGQQDALFSLGRASNDVTAPLLRLEHALHTFSAFVIMPLFAFANAGITVGTGTLNWWVAGGVALGLIVGKPLGITSAAVGIVALNLAALPRRVAWPKLHGCAWIGGIGFTMSLFIANLAFEGTALLDSAKVGILAGSAVAAFIGSIVVRMAR
jgi:Na+:H+ antiporter, NhaA family